MDCVFCKIIAGELPSKKIYEDEKILAFYDINPVTPVHFLVVPKRHTRSLNYISDNDDVDNICYALRKIPDLAVSEGIDENGYRVIINVGEDGGQTVEHLHFHVIGGKKLGWG